MSSYIILASSAPTSLGLRGPLNRMARCPGCKIEPKLKNMTKTFYTKSKSDVKMLG